jgi:hypothetical protein
VRSDAARELPGRVVVLVLLAVLLASAGEAAPRTDVVVLRNGDTITGELEELGRGRLTFKTDDVGTLAIEWDKVRSVQANASFEVDDVSGRQYLGSLRPGPKDGDIQVVNVNGERTLALADVVTIRRLGATIWQRLDGSLDVGLSYASSSELFTADLAARVVLTRAGHHFGVDGSSTLTKQPDAEETRRIAVALAYERRPPGHWTAFTKTQFEQNRELGFDLRSSLSAGAGRYLVHQRQHELVAALGLRVNKEEPLEGDAVSGLEAALFLTFDRFAWDYPKVDVYAVVGGFASLTDSGRVRFEADVRVRRELFRDFTVSLRVYESYDSEPPTEGSEKNDYGGSFGFGWTF